MTLDPLAVAVLAAVAAERLGEIALARRNTAALIAGRARARRRALPLIVALHAAWLSASGRSLPARPSLALLAAGRGRPGLDPATLGRRWTTRSSWCRAKRSAPAAPTASRPTPTTSSSRPRSSSCRSPSASGRLVFSLLNAAMMISPRGGATRRRRPSRRTPRAIGRPEAAMKDGRNAAGASVDPAEIERFSRSPPTGGTRAARCARCTASTRCASVYPRAHRRALRPRPHALDGLAGLAVVDVGCGAGLLCEPLARLGATTSPASTPRQRHRGGARAMRRRAGLVHRLSLRDRRDAARPRPANDTTWCSPWRSSSTSPTPTPSSQPGAACEARRSGRRLDHQPHAARLWARHRRRRVYLGWVPKGTHRWEKFVRPEEIEAAAAAAGLTALSTRRPRLQPRPRRVAAVARHRGQLHDRARGLGLRPALPWLVALVRQSAAERSRCRPRSGCARLRRVPRHRWSGARFRRRASCALRWRSARRHSPTSRSARPQSRSWPEAPAPPATPEPPLLRVGRRGHGRALRSFRATWGAMMAFSILPNRKGQLSRPLSVWVS